MTDEFAKHRDIDPVAMESTELWAMANVLLEELRRLWPGFSDRHPRTDAQAGDICTSPVRPRKHFTEERFDVST